MTPVDYGYERLAHAIIASAVTDYRRAIRQNDNRMLMELERFFSGNWYLQLSGGIRSGLYTEKSKKGGGSTWS